MRAFSRDQPVVKELENQHVLATEGGRDCIYDVSEDTQRDWRSRTAEQVNTNGVGRRLVLVNYRETVESTYSCYVISSQTRLSTSSCGAGWDRVGGLGWRKESLGSSVDLLGFCLGGLDEDGSHWQWQEDERTATKENCSKTVKTHPSRV